MNPHWSVNGETAMGGNGSIATLNNISFQPSRRLSVIGIQRYYGSKYWALHANSLSEGGQMRNEMGMLIGANWTVNRFLTLTAYTDYAYFHKPRYQASIASSAWDNYISGVYTYKNLSFLVRYRFKLRQKDNKDHTKLVNEYTQRARFAFIYSGLNWDCKTQADLSYSRNKANSFGFMLSEFVDWQPLPWLQTSANIGYFHTTDFASRLYIYERSMLYSFNFPTFYGEGIRWALLARANLYKKLNILLKVGTTYYFDRKHISSGLQQVDRSDMTDLEVQFIGRFNTIQHIFLESSRLLKAVYIKKESVRNIGLLQKSDLSFLFLLFFYVSLHYYCNGTTKYFTIQDKSFGGLATTNEVHQGFGIQSPSAFSFDREVINDHTFYPIYAELRRTDKTLTAVERKKARLLYRINRSIKADNFCFCPAMSVAYERYIKAACDKTLVEEVGETDKTSVNDTLCQRNIYFLTAGEHCQKFYEHANYH